MKKLLALLFAPLLFWFSATVFAVADTGYTAEATGVIWMTNMTDTDPATGDAITNRSAVIVAMVDKADKAWVAHAVPIDGSGAGASGHEPFRQWWSDH